LIEEKRARGPRKGRFAANPGRTLGEHPEKGGPVVAKNGRYGPYVSHDGVNATLSSDLTPETVTLEQAIDLLAARSARGAGKVRRKAAAKPTGAAPAPRAKPKAAATTAARPAAAPPPSARAQKKSARRSGSG
jgi:DNA topoisomerase-1